MSPTQEPRPRSILAVEDEPDHLMAVEMLFRLEKGFAFHGAATTAQAELILAREPIELILLDLALPGEDGLTFAKRIKAQERFRDIPIIAFSAFPASIYEEKALAAGCVEYLGKPFHPRDLQEVVKRHLPA